MNAGSKKSIKALVLDIDGVLTDGTVEIGGRSTKRVFLRDLDALALLRQAGIPVAFLTGETEAEARPMVERCSEAGPAIYGSKDKEAGIREMARLLDLGLPELCYLADGRRDVPALEMAGLALCPADGDRMAKLASHVVLGACGGRGAVAEAVDLILERNGMTAGQ